VDAETYYLAIERQEGAYQGRLHRGDPAQGLVLEDLELGPDVKITIDAKAYRLGTLVDKLTAFDTRFLKAVLDERGQLTLGSHLYEQTFGRLETFRSLPTEGDIRLRIVVGEGEEQIARLPWALLFRRGVFLCANGWSVGLCHQLGAGRDCELPPSPRILVAIPEPAGVPAARITSTSLRASSPATTRCCSAAATWQ
jgi:hypothetical protein